MSTEPIPGTSTRVDGAVTYPSKWTLLTHLFWHLRASFIAALICTYIVYGPHGVPALFSWAHTNATFQALVHDHPFSRWAAEFFFRGRPQKDMETALFFVIGTAAVHTGMYIILNGFFAFCSATGFLEAYRIPRTPRMKLTQGLISATLREAFVNQLIVGPVALFLIYTYVARFRSPFVDPASEYAGITPAPSLALTTYHMAMASLTNEVLFYAAHRLFHEVPQLYVWFHKQHHRYVGTVGIASEYAHPVEQIFANQLPTAAYMLYNSSNIELPVWFAWIAWRLWETYEAHSGYCFSESWLGQLGLMYGERAKFHDWHHSDNRGNYGVYWIDYLLGSMDSYAQLLSSEKKKTQ